MQWEKEFRYEVEDIILCMADIVRENRRLRIDVAELKLQVEKYREKEERRFKESQECFGAAVGIALKDALNGEAGPLTAKKILEAEAEIKGWNTEEESK